MSNVFRFLPKMTLIIRSFTNFRLLVFKFENDIKFVSSSFSKGDKIETLSVRNFLSVTTLVQSSLEQVRARKKKLKIGEVGFL